MQHTPDSIANPFALLIDPQTVLAALDRSERLGRLNSRICRPLDKPLIAHAGEELAAFDAAVEVEAEVEVESAVEPGPDSEN